MIKHMSICIEGVLKWKPKSLYRIFQNEDGSRPTNKEVVDYLNQKLKEGHRVLPLSGTECEGWDKVNGCPGHIKKEQES